MIVRIFIWIIIFDCAIAQQNTTDTKRISSVHEGIPHVSRFAILNLITGGEAAIRNAKLPEFESYIQIRESKFESRSFDLMSSFGNNIGFGGFHDRYAVINFTPGLDVNPLSFLNVRCLNRLSCYIPVARINEYYKIVFAQGITMIAIDNTLGLISSSSNWILETAAFVTKNLIISFLFEPFIERSESTSNPILEYQYRTFSVSIMF